MTFIDAEIWPCTIDEYHSDKSILGHTLLEEYIDNPERYAGIVAGEIKDEESGAFRLGRLLHAEMEGRRLTFQPEEFAKIPQEWHTLSPEDMAIYPADALNKNGGLLPPTNLKRKCFEEENVGRVLMKQSDYRRLEDFHNWMRSLGDAVICKDETEFGQVKAMSRSIRKHPRIAQLLELDGQHEFTLLCRHKETGLRCKARFDYFSPPWLIDWKTTFSIHPRKFADSAWNFGYYRQAAWYLDIAEAYLGPEAMAEWGELTFIFAAVLKDSPYTCRPFNLRGIDLGTRSDITSWIELGRRQNEKALASIKEMGGHYKAPEWDQVIPLDAPRYARFSDQLDIGA